MAQRSKNVSQGALDRVARWYFSPENLRRANDRLVDFMHRMPIANLFKEDELVMRSASDGQKYTMAMDSIHATYSAKYFAGPPVRKGQGHHHLQLHCGKLPPVLHHHVFGR